MAPAPSSQQKGMAKWYLLGLSLFALTLVISQSTGSQDHSAKLRSDVNTHNKHLGDDQHDRGTKVNGGEVDGTTIGHKLRTIQNGKMMMKKKTELEEKEDRDLKEEDEKIEDEKNAEEAKKNKEEKDSINIEKINGVILYLSGPMWEGYFFEHALPRLERNFLRCFPHYPVHVFHERLKPELQEKISTLLPSAPRVDFEDVSPIWKGPNSLPAGISEATVKSWMNTPQQSRFQGRGYRIMCRFWAGLVWSLPSMEKYDYYWRHDTDSILPSLALLDPFVQMKKQSCQYGFNRLKGEAPGVIIDLWPTYLRWLTDTAKISGSISPDGKSMTGEKGKVRKEVERFALDRNGKYWGPMYYNNFELGTFKLKRHPVLQDMFHWMDSKPNNGFLKQRWGDAPWHSLAIHTLFALDEFSDLGWRLSAPVVVSNSQQQSLMCNFSKVDVPYKHAAKKPGRVNAEQKCPSA